MVEYLVTPTIIRQALTALDRCDRCGAQARVRASFAAGDLYFCGHHAQKFEVAEKCIELELFDANERYLFE